MARSLTLVALPNASGIARVFTRETLRGLPNEIIENAELLVSELVANSVQANGLAMEVPVSEISHRHLFTLMLALSGSQLRIAVTDLVKGQPVPRAVTDDAESGRGLFLVQALSEQWGVTPRAPIGKTVWCVLSLRSPAPTAAVEHTASLPAAPLPRRTRSREVPPPWSGSPWASPLPAEGIERLLDGLSRL